MTVQSSTFAGNTSEEGGAIDNFGILSSVASCTISGNTASEWGGGIWNCNRAQVRIVNTIIAGNTAGFGPDICDSDDSVTAQNSLVESAAGWTPTSGTIVGEGPLLGPLADNGAPTETMALLPGSPILDAGIGAYQTKIGFDNQMLFDGTYSYQYDADGNCTAKYTSSNGWDPQIDSTATDITTYTWDNRNRLTAVTTYANYAACSHPAHAISDHHLHGVGPNRFEGGRSAR